MPINLRVALTQPWHAEDDVAVAAEVEGGEVEVVEVGLELDWCGGDTALGGAEGAIGELDMYRRGERVGEQTVLANEG